MIGIWVYLGFGEFGVCEVDFGGFFSSLGLFMASVAEDDEIVACHGKFNGVEL